MKKLLILLLPLTIYCTNQTCDKKVVHVQIEVAKDASGFNVHHIDTCGNIIRTMYHEGRKLDTTLLKKMLQGVAKSTPVSIHIAEDAEIKTPQ